MTEKEKIKILLKMRNQIASMGMDYKCSCTFVENRLTDPNVAKTFDALREALENQLRKQFDLHIEVPTYYREYSNFVPQKWQPCLVRDYSLDLWRVAVCSGKDAYGRPLFYSERNADGCCGWYHYLPLSKVTERLIGISKSYEQLIQELDAESTATAKNEQQ
ncbi:hypothetical protein [Prevotellamassilia timonensis]|uniref:hypothetical protein n=1 Tax=Prevotellamassilia timonensis TaxID=1852370 RepID=UPI0023F40D78|nr:hypothetical protein [Prevotellamassilia timonensis]MDD7440052.1 hypothetical protein [Prevotellamassilia timonensis]